MFVKKGGKGMIPRLIQVKGVGGDIFFFCRSCPYFIDTYRWIMVSVCDVILVLHRQEWKLWCWKNLFPLENKKKQKNNHVTKQLPSGLDVLVYSGCATLRTDDDGSCCGKHKNEPLFFFSFYLFYFIFNYDTSKFYLMTVLAAIRHGK